MEIVQLIDTDDLSNNYNDILENVCNTVYEILVNSNMTDIIGYSNSVQFRITYKIEPKKNPIKIREKLKHLGPYEIIKKDDKLLLNNSTCNICLNDYKCREYKRVLYKCKHTFHKKCVDKWLVHSKNMQCPLCRVSYCNILLID